MFIYRVKLKQNQVWEGAAGSFQDAINAACKGYLAPDCAVISVTRIKEIKV